MDLNEAEQWIWAMEKIAVQIRTMTQTICRTGTGDQHSQCEELVCCTENNIGICLHVQHSNPMHSETDHSRMNSYHPYIFQTNEERNEKSDLKYELSPTVLPPGRQRATKKTEVTDLAHHIEEVIKLSIAFKKQRIILKPASPIHRNRIISSPRHSDHIKCRHYSHLKRDCPNLGIECPAFTAPTNQVENEYRGVECIPEDAPGNNNW